MNSFEQVAWADKLVIDETVPWEIKNLCNLNFITLHAYLCTLFIQ